MSGSESSDRSAVDRPGGAGGDPTDTDGDADGQHPRMLEAAHHPQTTEDDRPHHAHTVAAQADTPAVVVGPPTDLEVAVVRIQSVYRGVSLRRMLSSSEEPSDGVHVQRKSVWRLNKRRGEAVRNERSAAQLLPTEQLSRIFVFLSLSEVVRVVPVTCKAWLGGARAPSLRQATLTLVTHASLRRIWSSTLLAAQVGAIHTSLRVCVSHTQRAAHDFGLFQAYFDLSPHDCCEIARRFACLTELVGCVRHRDDAAHHTLNRLVPQSPIGVHGHMYAGRDGLQRQSLLAEIGGARATLGRGSPANHLQRRQLLRGSQSLQQPEPGAPPAAVPPFQIAFPSTLKKLTLEMGLPAPQASVALVEVGRLAALEQLTLLTISELDLAPLLGLGNLRALTLRYSNLTGQTTRLRFPRRAQYAVLRRMAQLHELEVEEGFLVDPPPHPTAGMRTREAVRGCYLHELLLQEAPPTTMTTTTTTDALLPILASSPADSPAPSPSSSPSHQKQSASASRASSPSPSASSSSSSSGLSPHPFSFAAAGTHTAAASVSVSAPHQLQLRHLHLERTTLLRGNEAALTTLPTLTRLAPFRFAYDCDFAFLRHLPRLTALHLHFSTSTSPPPAMPPLLASLMTCRRLTELSLRGVAFGPSDELLLVAFLQGRAGVRLTTFQLSFCTLPSLQCLHVLAPTLRSLTLDSCVGLAMEPMSDTNGNGNGVGGPVPQFHARHVLFPARELVSSLLHASRLEELTLNGTFETLPYATRQLLTYPSPWLRALKKLVLTQGSAMLSSYDHRVVPRPEEVTLELGGAAKQREEKKNDEDEDASASDSGSDQDAPPMLAKVAGRAQRRSTRVHPPGLRR